MTVTRKQQVVGMSLTEPFRSEHGQGELVPNWGHVSMVFVHPDFQRQGAGQELMARLTSAASWRCLSLWTKDGNVPAHRLYSRSGFARTTDLGTTPHGEAMSRWERCP